MHESFLEQACLLPWKALGVAEPEQVTRNAIRANHVHIECEMPFIVAAQSLETPEGEEHFSLCLLDDPDQVRRFEQGPYPPHNRPRVVLWEQLFDERLSDFLGSRKNFRVLKRSLVTEVDGVSTLSSLSYGLVLEGAGKEIAIYADDAVPMAICLTSS